MTDPNRAGTIAVPGIEIVEREAWLDLFAAAPPDYATNAGITFKRLGSAGALAHQAVPITEFNRVFAAGLVEPWSDSEFGDAMAWLQQHAAAGWAMQISPAVQPSDVAKWANARGLEPAGSGWAKWYQAAPTVGSPRSESDLEIRSVGAAHSMQFGEVVQQGFGLPESTSRWFAALPGRTGWHTYLAFDNDRAVAAAAMFVHGRWAWLGVDATLADARMRGAQSSLITQRLRDGLTAGVLGFTAETGNPPAGEEASYTSFRNYDKAGFSLAYVRPNFKVAQPS